MSNAGLSRTTRPDATPVGAQHPCARPEHPDHPATAQRYPHSSLRVLRPPTRRRALPPAAPPNTVAVNPSAPFPLNTMVTLMATGHHRAATHASTAAPNSFGNFRVPGCRIFPESHIIIMLCAVRCRLSAVRCASGSRPNPSRRPALAPVPQSRTGHPPGRLPLLPGRTRCRRWLVRPGHSAGLFQVVGFPEHLADRYSLTVYSAFSAPL